jgi:hypothetical protein
MEGGRWVFGVGGRHEENERETRGGGEFIVVLGMRAATGLRSFDGVKLALFQGESAEIRFRFFHRAARLISLILVRQARIGIDVYDLKCFG